MGENSTVLESDAGLRIGQLWLAINGNGQPGIRQRVEELEVMMAEIKAIENERQRNHKENRDRQNVAIGLILVVIALLGFFGLHGHI